MTTQRFSYNWRARLLVVPFAALVAACASSGPVPIFSREAGQGENVTIVADNQNFLDATIYAIWGGSRDRIGMVTGKSSQTFEVPLRGSDLQLQIDLIGSGSMTTDRIGVFQGDHVEVVIPPTAE